jgi:hypothetical protein
VAGRRSLALARSALGSAQLGLSRGCSSILCSLVLVELLVGGLDEFGGSEAVIRVGAHANAYATGWLALIGPQSVLDATKCSLTRRCGIEI